MQITKNMQKIKKKTKQINGENQKNTQKKIPSKTHRPKRRKNQRNRE